MAPAPLVMPLCFSFLDSRMVPHRMTLEIHKSNFSFSIADEKLRGQIWDVLASYGFHLTSFGAADVHGHIAVEARSILPTVPSGLREVGRDAAGVAIWQGEGCFFLEAPGTVFVVDLATKQARGSILVGDFPRVGVVVVWLIMWSLHLLLRCRRLFPLHAAALTLDGASGLIATGSSGSGKTTLACNLLRSGWRFLSDDTVLLHPSADAVEVCAFRINFSLREDGRALFPDLIAHGQARPTGERKHWVPVRTLYPEQAQDVCTPRALVFPEITGETRSRIVPVTPAESLHRLVEESSLLRFRQDWGEEHLALLVRLVHQAPGYRLEAGRDLLEHPDLSHQLLAPLLNESSVPNILGDSV